MYSETPKLGRVRRLECPTTAMVLLVFRTSNTGSLAASNESAINFPSDVARTCPRPGRGGRLTHVGIFHSRRAFRQKRERTWENPSSALAEQLHRAVASLPKSLRFRIRSLRE